MRIPRSVAWLLLILAFFTAGILRQYHERIPRSPFLPALVGSLLFAGVFLLLLVAAWEYRTGPRLGRGLRIGSLTPILLILFFEKWISLGIYDPVFDWISPKGGSDADLDAMYRAFAGAGLLLICLIAAYFSPPTARKTWRLASPSRWPRAALATAAAVAGTYLVIGGLAAALGGGFRLRWPETAGPWGWILVGQTVRAFSEEVYYRGLVMHEMYRLAPRLGAADAAARRWVALGSSAVLFAMEHMRLGDPWDELARQGVFTLSLGLLFGILVLVTENLHFAAGVHAWINWLILGVAPWFADASGRSALPAGTYIGVALALAFILAYLMRVKPPEPSAV